MEGNLRFEIDWASVLVGIKFTVFALFTLYLRVIFKCKPPPGGGGGGEHIFRGAI